MRPALTCGFRVPAYYVCERPVADGSPLEYFMLCPPPYVDMEAINLGTSGMRIIERQDFMGIGTGVFDLWDYVSHEDNPWPTDFMEQTRAVGTSRRLPAPLIKDKNFQKLRAHPYDPTLSSRHIYVHSRAIIVDPESFYKERTGIKFCPAGISGHDHNETTWEMCTALWWEMVGKTLSDGVRRHRVELPRNWKRKGYTGPTLSYKADHMPVDATPSFLTGIIMSIPLMKMEIPRDDSGDNKHERLAKLLEDGGWQYAFEVTDD